RRRRHDRRLRRITVGVGEASARSARRGRSPSRDLHRSRPARCPRGRARPGPQARIRRVLERLRRRPPRPRAAAGLGAAPCGLLPRDALEKMHEALPSALFLVEDPDLHRWASGEFPAGELAESDTLDIVDFEQLLTKRATRIVMREVNGTAEEFAAAVDRLGLHEVSYSVGWSNWLDIAPDGT